MRASRNIWLDTDDAPVVVAAPAAPAASTEPKAVTGRPSLLSQFGSIQTVAGAVREPEPLTPRQKYERLLMAGRQAGKTDVVSHIIEKLQAAGQIVFDPDI